LGRRGWSWNVDGVLDDRWGGRVGWGAVTIYSRCDKKLGVRIELDCGFAIGEEIHDSVLDRCVGQGIAADVSAAGIPLK
jgi:hypothetical protein